jgi:hypothetical protein
MTEATSNGKVAIEVAEQAVQETVAPAKLWLHPDALKPRDYLRGKIALRAVLDELEHDSCYDFLGTDEMYTWCMWALKSRTNPKFTWDEALDTEFREFRMGEEVPPQTQPSESSGKSETTPNGSGSKPQRRKPATEPASSPSSG